MSKTARWLRWIGHFLAARAAESRALELADLAEPAFRAALEERGHEAATGRSSSVRAPWTAAMVRGYLRAYAAAAVARAAVIQSGLGGARPKPSPGIALRAVEILADRASAAVARPACPTIRRAA